MVQKLTKDDDIKDYHRKRCYKLSIRSIEEVPYLLEPTDEQKEWALRKLKARADTWKDARSNNA